MNLLQQAKKVGDTRKRKEYTKDEQELAVGWATGEVSMKQVRVVIGCNSGVAPYVFLANALRCFINKGIK